jgi:prepilin-type N-terminal cleavage/methylation domain-containing protein
MKKQAFTLIEVLIAIILVGLAIASLLGANLAFTRANGSGAQLSTAEFLIEQIRELTVMKVYNETHNDLSPLDGITYSHPNGPIGSNGEVLNDFASYSQQITVKNVKDNDFTSDGDTSSHFVKITVKILLSGKEISSACWIRAKIPTT